MTSLPLNELIFEYISPTLGVIMASATFAAPISSVKDAIRREKLGDLNPMPWAMMAGNCVGWIAYSFMIKDYFVLFANVPGFMLSIWLNMTAIKLQFLEAVVSRGSPISDPYETVPDDGISKILAEDENDNQSDDTTPIRGSPSGIKYRSATAGPREDPTANGFAGGPTARKSGRDAEHLTTPHERVVLCVAGVWVLVLSVVAFGPFSGGPDVRIVGLTVNANLMFFYCAPLSTIAKVVSLRDSSGIHVRTMVMNTVNGVFWSIYGLAVADAYIYVPNLCGVFFGVVQILLRIVFPIRNIENQDNPTGIFT